MQKFIHPISSYSLQEIAKYLNGQLIGTNSVETTITDVADITMAQPQQITFISNHKYLSYLPTTKASAVIVSKDEVEKINSTTSGNGDNYKNNNHNLILLVVSNPYIAFAKVMQLFYPQSGFTPMVSPKAYISEHATIGQDCFIGVGAVIDSGVTIGNQVYIGYNTVISNNAIVGDNTVIYSNASIKYASIGKNCTLHDGVRIGQDGFGFAPNYKDGHVKIPQVGGVVIGDNVEIGSNTCIDRGALKNTTIGNGTKLDNLVQIGHNVVIGQNCFLGGQVGISGGTIIEDNVAIAGQAGLAPQITIHSGTQIAPQSGVFRNIPANTTVAGSPSRPFFEYMRLEALQNQLLKQNKTKNR